MTHNAIMHGRYWKAFEEIPDELVSDAMRKYAVSDIAQQRRDADNCEANGRTIHKQKVKLYVRRGFAFMPLNSSIGGFEKTGSIVPQNGL